MGNMENSKDSERKDEANFLWEEFKIRVETYKSYLNIALQANVFFYVTTGGVLAFYLSSTTKALPFLEFLLLLPILIGAVLAGIFLHAAQLQKKASVIIEEIRKDSSKKGHEIAKLPDINLLYLLLRIFGCIFFLVVISLIFLPHLLNGKLHTPEYKDLTYFTVIAAVIVFVGVFSTNIATYLDEKLGKTKKPSMTNNETYIVKFVSNLLFFALISHISNKLGNLPKIQSGKTEIQNENTNQKRTNRNGG
ncbi:hypothetical protein BH20ACI1_BH20ACI1_27490 [soil metagenome]